MAPPPPDIERELQQSKSYSVREESVFVNLMRTHDRLASRLTKFLRGYSLSEPQYNALRILRGAGEDGHPCQAITARMVTRVPDVTRLVDRLLAKGLVRRERSTRDRRVVYVKITDAGLVLLASIDRPLVAFHRAQLGHLDDEDLQSLERLLTRVRETDDTTG